MDATLENFLNMMVSKGKITQEEADEKRAKHDKKETAKKGIQEKRESHEKR